MQTTFISSSTSARTSFYLLRPPLFTRRSRRARTEDVFRRLQVQKKRIREPSPLLAPLSTWSTRLSLARISGQRGALLDASPLSSPMHVLRLPLGLGETNNTWSRQDNGPGCPWLERKGNPWSRTLLCVRLLRQGRLPLAGVLYIPNPRCGHPNFPPPDPCILFSID
ncbi:hypothetical protein MRX96_048978 [Rhipicephalus microplus]